MHTVRSIIDNRATTQAGSVFLIAPETGYEQNYQGLRQQVVSIEQHLIALGLKNCDKVAFLMNNGLWTAQIFLGVMYSGRVVVPLNGVCGDDQLRHVIEHSELKLIFVDNDYRHKYNAVLSQISSRILIISTCRNTGPQWPVTVAPGGQTGPDTLEADDEALLIYTSGTTGLPKGVVLTHKAVIAGGSNTVAAHQLVTADRALCVLPLYHINGEMVTVMAPLLSGSSVVMPHKFSTTDFWSLIDRWECTWFSVVPTIIAYLLEQAERLDEPACPADYRPHLRFGRSASSPLSPVMHQQFEQQFAVAVIETMGLSETAAQILSNPMPPTQPRYGSPGIAIGNQAMVIDKYGKEQMHGVSGELMIRGDNLLKEYYKNPDATTAAFNADGWLHTGDQAYQDADGYFFITGRLNEIIIKGGENIAPREIDEVLYQHVAVLEAAAFPIPDRNYGQEILACVALKPGTNCSNNELEAFCVKKLGKFKAPKSIWIVDELPKGPSGKIQRLKLIDVVLKNQHHWS